MLADQLKDYMSRIFGSGIIGAPRLPIGSSTSIGAMLLKYLAVVSRL